MNLIAVTDIFGKTQCFEELLNDISPNYSSIEVVDPYNGERIDFRDEDEAYKHFLKVMGVEQYSKHLNQKLIGKENVEQLLLGFSVGASAVWLISETLKLHKKTKGVCFYSSQVRKYLHMEPKIGIDFFFSKSEPTYDINAVASRLSCKENVNCYETDYFHGFMNKKSPNFNQVGYEKYLERLNGWRLSRGN